MIERTKPLTLDNWHWRGLRSFILNDRVVIASGVSWEIKYHSVLATRKTCQSTAFVVDRRETPSMHSAELPPLSSVKQRSLLSTFEPSWENRRKFAESLSVFAKRFKHW